MDAHASARGGGLSSPTHQNAIKSLPQNIFCGSGFLSYFVVIQTVIGIAGSQF